MIGRNRNRHAWVIASRGASPPVRSAPSAKRPAPGERDGHAGQDEQARDDHRQREALAQ